MSQSDEMHDLPEAYELAPADEVGPFDDPMPAPTAAEMDEMAAAWTALLLAEGTL